VTLLADIAEEAADFCDPEEFAEPCSYAYGSDESGPLVAAFDAAIDDGELDGDANGIRGRQAVAWIPEAALKDGAGVALTPEPGRIFTRDPAGAGETYKVLPGIGREAGLWRVPLARHARPARPGGRG
jgi:hypothetical protein